jgi:hypothetical protein
MIQGGDTGLRRHLDAIESKGLRLVLDQARGQALSRALAWAAPASALGGLAFAISSQLVRPWPVMGALAICLPPTIVGFAVYLCARRGRIADRSVALARMDQRFRIKDRILTVDEFMRVADRSPYQTAAIQEASPWLERAALGAVASAPLLTVRPSRLWLWPVLALVLVVSSFFIPRLGSVASPIAPVADEAASVAVVPGAPLKSSAPQTPRLVETSGARAAAARSGGQPGRAGDGAGMSSVLRRLISLLSPDRGAAGGPRAPGKPGAASEAAAGGGESAGRGAQGAAGRGGSRGATGEKPEAWLPDVHDQTLTGGAGNEDQSDTASAPASSGQSAGARQDAPSARQAEPPKSGSSSNQSGEGQEPGGRSRRGDQSQQGGEQAGGQGDDSGQRGGADAGAKKGRGVSSLLLATPMQDHLAGMASPGRTSTTTRDGVPHPLPVTPDQAGDRGSARGEASRTAPRAISPQDQRLTRDYFTQRNASGN